MPPEGYDERVVRERAERETNRLRGIYSVKGNAVLNGNGDIVAMAHSNTAAIKIKNALTNTQIRL